MLTIHNTPEYAAPAVSAVSKLAPPHEAPDLESSCEAYARRFSGGIGEYFLQVQAQVVRRMLPSKPCRILDVGGGHGQLVQPLSAAGFEVTVFASDATCRERLDRLVGRPAYQLITGNLLDLPLGNDSFDVVLGFRLLPHLQHWQRFLAEICRVAASTVIFDYPDMCSVNRFSDYLFALKREIEKDTRTYRCFDQQQVIGELRSHQFLRCSAYRQFLFPMALHRMMKMPSISRSFERISRTVGLTARFGSPVIIQATST